MESVIKSDVFFFITAVAVIGVSAVLIIALYYLIKILRDVASLSRKAREEGGKILNDVSGISDIVRRQSEEIANDVKDIRQSFRRRALQGTAGIDLFLKKLGKFTRRRRKPRL